MVDTNKPVRFPRTQNSKLSEERRSTEATPATRRQSVKDLFKQYGIQRPAGLLSSESVADNLDETPLELIAHINCHVCAWKNGPNTACRRCGHVLCQKCDLLSPQDMKDDRDCFSYSESIPKLELQNPLQDIYRHESSGIPERDSQKQSSRQEFQNQEMLALGQERKQSIRSEKSLVLTPKESAIHCDAPINPLVYTKKPASPHQQIAASRTPDSIQDSTLAEISASSPTLLPVAMQVSNSHSHHRYHSHRGHHARHKRENKICANSQTRSSSRIKHDECASLGCRATHAGHKPYRHSISCLQKREACLNEVDGRKLVRVGHLNEFCVENLERHIHCDHELDGARCIYNRDIGSLEQGKIKHSQLSQSRKSPPRRYGHASRCNNGQLVPPCERHECPREANSRDLSRHSTHKSSKRSIRVCSEDAVEDLPHCSADCQCEAPQSVKHNLRCCEQRDSHVLVHHHSTPQREELNSVVPVILTLKPALIPKKLSNQPHLDSTAHVQSHVAAPMPRRRLAGPPWMNTAKGKSKKEQDLNVKRLMTQDISSAREIIPTSKIATTELPSLRKIHPSCAAHQKYQCFIEHNCNTTQGTSLVSSKAEAHHDNNSLHSEYPSGETATVPPSQKSFIPPCSKHEPSYDTCRPSEFSPQEKGIEPFVSSKTQDQEGSENFEGGLDESIGAMMDEASRLESVNSKRGSKAGMHPEKRRPTPVCGHRRSWRRIDHGFEDANYFKARRNKSQATDAKVGEIASPLKPPLRAAKDGNERTTFECQQHDIRLGMAEQGDDVGLEQRGNIKSVSEGSEASGSVGGVGIQGITVVIHLEGREDLVVRTNLNKG